MYKEKHISSYSDYGNWFLFWNTQTPGKGDLAGLSFPAFVYEKKITIPLHDYEKCTF